MIQYGKSLGQVPNGVSGGNLKKPAVISIQICKKCMLQAQYTRECMIHCRESLVQVVVGLSRGTLH